MPVFLTSRLRPLHAAWAWLLASLATPALAQGVASIDWTLAETLVALGEPPAAVAQVEDYHRWVGAPHLPATVADLGLRTQPNLEQLAHATPERILISPMFAAQAPRLGRMAEVDTLALYRPGVDTWSEMLALTRRLGALTARQQAAETLIATTEARLRTLRDALPASSRPLLLVQLIDARHARVFGEHGLFQAVLERLGLENAWHGQTNSWGFSLVSLEALLALEEAQLVVVEPYPSGVEAELANSAIWQRLPGVTDDHLITLPPVWSFGALPSAQRFAELLVAALGGDA